MLNSLYCKKPIFPFYTFWIHQKTISFVVFQWGIVTLARNILNMMINLATFLHFLDWNLLATSLRWGPIRKKQLSCHSSYQVEHYSMLSPVCFQQGEILYCYVRVLLLRLPWPKVSSLRLSFALCCPFRNLFNNFNELFWNAASTPAKETSVTPADKKPLTSSCSFLWFPLA